MKTRNIAAGLVAALALSACTTATVDQPVTRTAPLAQNKATAFYAPSYRVADVRVQVPTTLSVSEANAIYPNADIVWREDPLGDRHDQVRQIVERALKAGVKDLDGQVDVVLDVEVLQFHALTERTRYTIGGRHEIRFMMTLSDPKTGEVLEGSRIVDATFMGLGGAEALKAERDGITQKVRISARIAQVIRAELSPEA